MNSLLDMIWIEQRKAFRSKMPLWTAIGSLFIPFGIAFLLFVSKNPEISQKLGLVSAKADLVAFAATDWATYLGLYGLIIGTGGFVLFVLVISWTFGREFADGTLKDMLAVPVPRAIILLAKFILLAVWSLGLALVIYFAGLFVGWMLNLPGWTPEVLNHGSIHVLITTGLAILVTLPFALFASIGRGYLLPIGLAVLILMLTNLVTVVGWGEFFPWAIPGLFTQGKAMLTPVSFWIVIITGLAGMAATYLWWKLADQNR